MSSKPRLEQGNTEQEVQAVFDYCRNLFKAKLGDYGASWRIMRPSSLTDQIFIKAGRIRTLQETGVSKVDEGIEPEFIAIVNYGIVAMVQLELNAVETPDLSAEEALALYDKKAKETLDLLKAKNHDYGEAWRQMRVSSIVDLILTKIYRTKQIEDNDGKTAVSEGLEANYMDMVNYAIFSLIKIYEC